MKASRKVFLSVTFATITGAALSPGRFWVTLLEAVGTGLMYLSAILLLTKPESLRTEGWIHLFFYCFLFVLGNTKTAANRHQM